MDTGVALVIATAVLVGVTLWYAYGTHQLAQAAKRQADANARMAEEMRQQRLIGVQPIVVPTQLFVTNWSIAATVVNVGNGPSFDLSFCLRSLDRGKGVDEGSAAQVLKPGEPLRVEFRPRAVFDDNRETDPGRSPPVFPRGDYTLVASYHDLYGNRLSAIRPFELRESHTEGGAELQVHLGSIRFCGYDVQPAEGTT